MSKRILPHLKPLPRLSVCFWCEKMFGKLTEDHIVPVYVRGQYTRTVWCCFSCNQERSKISSLGAFHKLSPEKQLLHLRAWKEAKVKIRPLCYKYAALIYEKLEGEEQRICLKELTLASGVKEWPRSGSK